MQKLIHASFEGRQEALPVNDAALALVRQHAQRDLTADEVFLGRMCLTATGPNRRHECFTVPQLERFATTIVGKSLLEGHDTTKRPIGRFYAARVEAHGQEHRLMTDYYVNRVHNAALVSDIELGIQKHSSIGAYVVDEFVCNLCQLDYSGVKNEAGQQCAHQAGREYENQVCTVTRAGPEKFYEAIEGSLVYLGAHPAAELTTMSAVHLAKAALLTEKPPEEKMELQQALARIEALEQAAKESAALMEDGKAYRDWLKSEVTRLAGLVKKTTMYAGYLKHMEDAPATTLRPVYDELQTDFAEKFQTQPTGVVGDPQADESRRQAMVREQSPIGSFDPFANSLFAVKEA